MEISGVYIRAFVVLLMAGGCLAGCSSGGSTAMTPVAFTSFSAVTNGQAVQAKQGISQTMNLASPVTTTLSLPDTANSTAQFTYTNIGTSTTPAMTNIAFTTPGSSVSWSNGNIDCTSLAPLCTASNTSATGRVVNALDPSVVWNYQSFGYWINTTSLSSTAAGAISFGSRTPVTGLPTTGTTVPYNGRSGGVYIDPSGNLFTYSGTMTSTVDFVGRSITFNSNVGQIIPVAGGVAPANSALNINTTFNYLPGTSQFSAPVNATGQTAGGLSGTLSGTFYGPTAQEIGGTFSLNATTGREAMVGGFGGKR